MAEPLVFPSVEAQRLEPYLPPLNTGQRDPEETGSSSTPLPFVTLTFATSLDSALSLGPGIRTPLSGPQSKAMTHYLRSRHDAVCVGVGTAIADDPGLNCRLAAANPDPVSLPAADTAGVGALLGLAPVSAEGTGFPQTNDAATPRQPRPIVIDPMLRWDFNHLSKVMQLAREGRGLAPYIITAVPEPPLSKKKLLEDFGGKFILLNRSRNSRTSIDTSKRSFDWRDILAAVRSEGLQSIMVEGGGEVINSLLSHENAYLVDSVVVTLAPTWLGQGSVFVCPPRKTSQDNLPSAVARLTDTTWMPLGEDVVLSGRIANRD
ncbi:putative riboflavin biosynthesis protein Rib7 [Xylariaceae sp. FL0662B]|nr:putative riboflavin biosynthesis protein Rib7 [Xylariaceae sp. FL0662B]